MHDNIRLSPGTVSHLGDPVLALVDIEMRGQSVADMLCEALHSVRVHLGMDVAFVAEFADGLRVFRYVDGNNQSMAICAGDSDPLCDTYCERVLDGRLPQLIPDTSQLPTAGGRCLADHRGPVHRCLYRCPDSFQRWSALRDALLSELVP